MIVVLFVCKLIMHCGIKENKKEMFNEGMLCPIFFNENIEELEEMLQIA